MAYMRIYHLISSIECCFNLFEYVECYPILCLLIHIVINGLHCFVYVRCVVVLVMLFCWCDDVYVVAQDLVVGGYAAG